MQSQSHIYQYLNEKHGTLKNITSLSGGDISEVYKIETPHQNFVLKTSDLPQALAMFQAEENGLNALSQSGIIKTPDVFEVNRIDKQSFILMEFVETQTGNRKSQKQLGRQLAALHSIPQPFFGGAENNYIASLVQDNTPAEDWISFYTNKRLIPQLDFAGGKGYFKQNELPSREKILTRLKDYIGSVKPSLLHGDLWSGNYLTDLENNPVLIDPAFYYGHYEVDLAMTRLFGGFSGEFYSAYHEIIPQENGHQERQEIYQLYYLLVHLNLFGASYLGGVKNILSKYFH